MVYEESQETYRYREPSPNHTRRGVSYLHRGECSHTRFPCPDGQYICWNRHCRDSRSLHARLLQPHSGGPWARRSIRARQAVRERRAYGHADD